MRGLILSLTLCGGACALADWPQFRGPDGAGISTAPLVDSWSDTTNVLWKKELPGSGSSSPVIAAGRIFLTTANGDADGPDRHVLCFDAATGTLLWDRPVKSALPEQKKIREDHGYASATPVATSKRLFVFFGKSGVFCFDHGGREIWNTKVGAGLHGWGSAASLSLHGSAVYVNASVESESLVALDQETGKELWKVNGIQESWHAPVITTGPSGPEVIMAMAGEVKSFSADAGNPLWQCKSGIGWYMCPQPLVKDGTVYAVGGRSGTGGLAIKLGGSGNVTESHRLWTLRKGTNVPSPLIHGDHLYFAHENLGIAHCVDLKTGDFVYSEKMEPDPGQIYASPILADGKIYYLGRGGQTVVIKAAPEFKVLSTAKLENGRGNFNATPAVDGNRLVIRSGKFLYCIGQK
jgi:outer membrane protein assembly factor BamB